MAEQLITENIDLWTSVVKAKSSAGRGANKKLGLYGIEKLRELIVDLGMRGLLIKQDPNDGSASELLQKIAKEKSQLEQQGILKKHQAFSQVSEKDEPFSLPSNWGWARLGNIARRIHYGYTAKANPEISNVKLLRITDIQNDKVDWDKVPGCKIRERELSQFKLNPGDLLIARTGGTVGKSFWVEDIKISAVFASYLIRIEKCNEVYVPYLKVFLRSSLYWRQLITGARGAAQPNVNGRTLGAMALPLPPLAEQHRIVAKVDELMALCDQLEQEQENELETHETLVSTLLSALTSAVADPSQLADAWQRIQDNFDIIFTTESSIDQLKQTILQLAVMGKLVPQDTTDKAASELLNMIAIEKDKLSKSGKIKKQNALERVTINHIAKALPCQWECTRLGNLINLVSGQHLKPTDYSESEEKGAIPYLTGPAEFGDLYPHPSRYTFKRMSVAQKGDLLITCKGSGVGKLNFAHEQIFISRQLMAIQPILISSKFLMLLVDSLNKYLRSKIVGIAIPGISRRDVLDAVVAIPPLNEQHRIVAKVDELMALCDKIKERLAAAQVTKLNLADSLVEQAIN